MGLFEGIPQSLSVILEVANFLDVGRMDFIRYDTHYGFVVASPGGFGLLFLFGGNSEMSHVHGF